MRGSPVILVVSDDPGRREELASDLARRFAPDYEVRSTSSDALGTALEGIGTSARLATAIAAPELPAAGTTGVDVMRRLRRRHPDARRVLLVPRGEWRAHPVRQAMVLGDVDGYLFVPWIPREQWLYLPMTEYLSDWSRSQPAEEPALRLVGEQWQERSYVLRDVLARATIPFTFHEPGSEAGAALLQDAGLDGSVLPVVVFFTGQVLVDPTDAQLVEALGFHSEADGLDCDVAIVGAGPSGLSAAVYASSEGLRTTLVEPAVPGGQAGTSSMIRNYLGFPRGLSGAELTNRALEQAWLFGADLLLAQRVTGLAVEGDVKVLTTADGGRIEARAVVLATGVEWRRLGVPRLEARVGAGVFYGAAGAEADALAGEDVFVVGGGNSAGQAAVHLARRARRVTVAIRREGLEATMSDYLVRELDAADNVVVRPFTEVVDGAGEGRLQTLTLRDNRSGAREEVPAAALFVMIGAEPRTGWLAGAVARDPKGYVLTGADVPRAAVGDARQGPAWREDRPPAYLETSLPGVFAVGDLRSGSVKRVATSVGSGAIAVQAAHEYLGRRSS